MALVLPRLGNNWQSNPSLVTRYWNAAMTAIETAFNNISDALAKAEAAQTSADQAQHTAESVATDLTAETSARVAADTLLAPKLSPNLTGTPTAPTAGPGTSTTQIATTAFVEGELSGLGLFSGAYTPTLTPGSNVDSVTAYTCQYLRVGSVVTVSGQMVITPTAVGSVSRVGISLPVASAFTAAENCGGVTACTTLTEAGTITADTTNARASLSMLAQSTASGSFSFTFTYKVI